MCIFWSKPYSRQGRSDGGNIGIYIPQNQSTLQIFMWLLVVFFLFDPGQIVVDFEIGMISKNLYPPPNEIPGYAPDSLSL